MYDLLRSYFTVQDQLFCVSHQTKIIVDDKTETSIRVIAERTFETSLSGS